MKKPLILVTNDDGITAPGLRSLVVLMKEIGDVVVWKEKFDKRTNLIGFIVGLIANTVGTLLYIILFSDLSITETYNAAVTQGHVGSLLALGAILNLANIRCWGGDLMQNAGGTLVKHYKEMAFMGFLEVLLNLNSIFKNIKSCKEEEKHTIYTLISP